MSLMKFIYDLDIPSCKIRVPRRTEEHLHGSQKKYLGAQERHRRRIFHNRTHEK